MKQIDMQQCCSELILGTHCLWMQRQSTASMVATDSLRGRCPPPISSSSFHAPGSSLFVFGRRHGTTTDWTAANIRTLTAGHPFEAATVVEPFRPRTAAHRSEPGTTTFLNEWPSRAPVTTPAVAAQHIMRSMPQHGPPPNLKNWRV
jgi:hypothetical protein